MYANNVTQITGDKGALWFVTWLNQARRCWPVLELYLDHDMEQTIGDYHIEIIRETMTLLKPLKLVKLVKSDITDALVVSHVVSLTQLQILHLCSCYHFT